MHAHFLTFVIIYQLCDNVALLFYARPDHHFNWTCANILIGSGDPYSTAGAKAFESAAIDNQIYVCKKVQYESGSVDMRAAITQIMDNRCCMVTAVFGQAQDLASLFLEAHVQDYAGEWIVGDGVMADVDDLVKHLKKHLKHDSSVHKLLRGMHV